MQKLNDELIINQVRQALAEDIGSGDLTAALVPDETFLEAHVITREPIVVCGTAWFETCFQQLCPSITIDWHVSDGQAAAAGETLCGIHGAAKPLLTAERTALNFLQTLSAVATRTRQFVTAIQGTNACIVDTRKTIPGLRAAQKYAVRCGGGTNHRMGLYDGILIKENHIIAAGGIENILRKITKIAPVNIQVQIEVETINELLQALQAGAKMILLDNFSVAELHEAVSLNKYSTAGSVILEASGNITLDNVRTVAETGVNRISVGSLTKHIQAADLSMRFEVA